MAGEKNRAQLQALRDQLITTGGKQITGEKMRQMIGELIISLANILDDKNQNGGYPGLDSNGLINTSQIQQLSPVGYFLSDNGTWQPVSSGGTGVTTKTIDITAVTIVDLVNTSGTVLINMTSSNPNKFIKAVSNFANVDIVYLCPDNGVTVQFDDLTTVTGGNFKLFATPLVALGSSGGFIKFVKRGSIFYQESFIDQYV